MRKRGFTLIEVLIALVIFVVGALAVIRIFPPAFNVVQNSGYSTVATRLSDSILAQIKANGSTPDAVFDIKFDSNNVADNWGSANLVSSTPHPIESFWQDQNGAVVGTTDKNGSLPKDPTETAFNASALGHFRFIRGEKHEVQVVTRTDPISGTTIREPYILTNFPYDVNSGVRVYIGLAISGVTINSSGELDFTHATYKKPNDGTPLPFHPTATGTHTNRPLSTISIAGVNVHTRSAIPPSGIGAWVDNGTRYYVSYQWRYNSSVNPSGHTVNSEPMNIPDDSATSWSGADTMRVLQGAIINNETTKDRSVLAGPVPVKVRINLSVDSDGNVINFPNYFPPMTPNPIAAADRQQWGYLGYVPILGNPADTPPHTLPANLPVYVDYLVPDWRTLYDQSVSVQSSPPPPYHGEIFTPIRLLAPNPSPLGLLIDPTNKQLPEVIPATIPASNKGQINYPNFNEHIRTAYKGLDQWARQISPSAVSYVPYVNVSGLMNVPDYRGVYSSTGNNPVTTSYAIPDLQKYILPREPWREYYWDSSVDADIIYFHANNAGKSVRVSFMDTSGNTVSNQLLTIDKTIISAPSVIPTDYTPSGYVSKLELPAKASSILGISGVGVIARTAWLDGSQYRQSEVTGYRLANAH